MTNSVENLLVCYEIVLFSRSENNHSDFCVTALASLGYEKTCVLFNAAALASQIASEQNLDNDEGLKAAAKYYQVGVAPHSYILTFKASSKCRVEISS